MATAYGQLTTSGLYSQLASPLHYSLIYILMYILASYMFIASHTVAIAS